MNGRETVVLWVTAGIMTVLVAASLSSYGTGFFGGGYMLHMAWAYVVVLGGLALVLLLLRPQRGSPSDAPAAGRREAK